MHDADIELSIPHFRDCSRENDVRISCIPSMMTLRLLDKLGSLVVSTVIIWDQRTAGRVRSSEMSIAVWVVGLSCNMQRDQANRENNGERESHVVLSELLRCKFLYLVLFHFDLR